VNRSRVFAYPKIFAFPFALSASSRPSSAPPATDSTRTMRTNVLCEHLNAQRKYITQGLNMLVSPDDSMEDLLNSWVATIRTSMHVKSWWSKIARQISLREDSYEWRLSAGSIRRPWKEHDGVYFRDPNRPSTGPAFMRSHARDDPQGSSPSGSCPPPPDADDPQRPSPPTGQSSEEGPGYTKNTVQSSGPHDVIVSIDGVNGSERAMTIRVDARISADMLWIEYSRAV
jgi:hypothetical protein